MTTLKITYIGEHPILIQLRSDSTERFVNLVAAIITPEHFDAISRINKIAVRPQGQSYMPTFDIETREDVVMGPFRTLRM